MPPRYAYGGQALIEGVLMRGRDAIAVALRHPDGRIVWATERLDSGFHGTRWSKLPFIRGLVVLYETLVVGTRWLVRSANVAAEVDDPEPAERPAPTADDAAAIAMAESSASTIEPTAPTTLTGGGSSRLETAGVATASSASAGPASVALEPALGKGAIALMLGITLLAGIGIFFLLPLFLAGLVAGSIENGLVQHLVEGLIRVAIFIGYLVVIGLTPDIRRVFQYHGAEHMTIHALEAGDALTVDEVRRYPTAHQRCGTEFLVIVILLSILAFSLVGRQDPVVMISSRVLLIPVIAAIGYELLKLGARYRRNLLVKVLLYPGILVQKITTKRPTDDMIEVAIVSLEQAMTADGEAIPEGSGAFEREPMTIAGRPVTADGLGPADLEPPAA